MSIDELKALRLFPVSLNKLLIELAVVLPMEFPNLLSFLVVLGLLSFSVIILSRPEGVRISG